MIINKGMLLPEFQPLPFPGPFRGKDFRKKVQFMMGIK